MTEGDIRETFGRVYFLLDQAQTAEKSKRPSDIEITDIGRLGAMLLEGFLIDVHRIAEAQTKIAREL